MRRLLALVLLLPLLTLPTAALSAAKGAIVMEPESGRVLFEKEADLPLPMASTTKILTVLLTLEQPDLDSPFEVDAAALRVEGSSMGLKPGDMVTLRTLAYGMMLHSGNDAAGAAATAIAGDKDSFAVLMNDRARRIGMTASNFTNPSGLSEEGHQASARDMAKLAAEALKNPDFREMASAKNVAVEFGSPPVRQLLLNHNRLLWRYPYAIGVKTGFTKAAGRCLVSAAHKDGVTLICVTLNCPDDFNAHQRAYERYFDTLERVDFAGEAKGIRLPVVGGTLSSLELVLEGPLAATLPKGQADACRLIIEAPPFVYAPVPAGHVLGRAAVYHAGELVAESPLLAAHSVSAPPYQPTLFERLFGE